MPVQRAYTAPPNLTACERWGETRLPSPARRSPVILQASERTDSGVDVEMDTEPHVVGNANFHVPSPLHEVDPQWKPTEPDCEIWEDTPSPATTEGSGWESHATESCNDPCDLPTHMHIHTQRVCRPLQQRRSSYHHPYSPPNSGRTMSPSPHRRRSSRPRDRRENLVFGTFITPPSEASPNRLSASMPLIIVTSEPAPFLKARRPSSPFSATSPYDLRPPSISRTPTPIGAGAFASLDTSDTCSVSSREFLLTPPESPLLGIYEKQPQCVSPPEPEPLDILAADLREALDELDTI
ncbi:hypothetical protein M427DRAFT_55041 [Gonapodya prolifera JEL478]|uniref:Uncharacterized protein n=1 Tax=Gonapodya prolifera (strain JEL478) TaxID=1344416 RepID=A0A139AJZ6_GONPJ|nr:hypothetical protein M427DRAFT_55041 [Gonapodya prolifera JEL478]|eukprot:KXS17018.1 hypothetical protein M427DRAFT_55041 [Gonapodya prolifera JEL478]